MTDDPFAVSSEVVAVKVEQPLGAVGKNGRYRLPAYDNPNAWIAGYAGKQRPWGWARTTNIIGAYVDTRALGLWENRTAWRGLLARRDLLEELETLADPTDEQLNDLFERAKVAGKGNVAAARGSLRHDELELWITEGRRSQSARIRAQLDVVQAEFARHLLRPIPDLTERIVVNTGVDCAGKFDGALYDMLNDVLMIDDLKTKKRHFWTLLELRAQLAVYAYADAMWDPVKACYVPMPPVSRQVGIVIHMPVDGAVDSGEPAVHLIEVDLVKGWETARRARQCYDDRAEAKGAGALAAAFRKAPDLNTVEAYAARLRCCESLTEGSALYAEIVAKGGLWCAELADEARVTAYRLGMREGFKDLAEPS